MTRKRFCTAALARTYTFHASLPEVKSPDLNAETRDGGILNRRPGGWNPKDRGIPGKLMKDEEIRGIAANKRLTTVLKNGKSGSFFEHVQPEKESREGSTPADDRRFGRPA